jgi:hypothetical protein
VGAAIGGESINQSNYEVLAKSSTTVCMVEPKPVEARSVLISCEKSDNYEEEYLTSPEFSRTRGSTEEEKRAILKFEKRGLESKHIFLPPL